MDGSVRLWPSRAPGSETWTHDTVVWQDETNGSRQVCNVATPTVTPFLPDPATANGTAVIVAPGGGFFYLADDHEGADVARWLTTLGVTAFLLRYRLTYTGDTREEFQRFQMDWFTQRLSSTDLAVRHPEEAGPGTAAFAIDDGEQAMRIVRGRASEWSVDPNRIGFLGFSAGGFITSAVALTNDAEARPNFVAPIYGAYVRSAVDQDAPPLFCTVATDDALCVDGCIETYRAWLAAGRPAELHAYARGGHGFGMRSPGLPVDTWTDRLVDWMRSLGYLA